MKAAMLSAVSAIVVGMALLSHEASANDLVIEQVGPGGGPVLGNFATGAQVGNNNETYIRQTANSNTASMNINGANNNDILVIQNTQGNHAQYAGDASGSSGNGNIVAILQDTGNFNVANFVPNNGASNNILGAQQDGVRNVVGGGGSVNQNRGFGPFTVADTQTPLAGMLTTQGLDLDDKLATIEGNNNFAFFVHDGN